MDDSGLISGIGGRELISIYENKKPMKGMNRRTFLQNPRKARGKATTSLSPPERFCFKMTNTESHFNIRHSCRELGVGLSHAQVSPGIFMSCKPHGVTSVRMTQDLSCLYDPRLLKRREAESSLGRPLTISRLPL